MFEYSYFNGNIEQWNVKNVTDMSKMFFGSKFKGNVSDWCVSGSADVSEMFDNCPLAKYTPVWYNVMVHSENETADEY